MLTFLRILFLATLFSSNYNPSYGQDTNVGLYNWFDETVGKSNLDLNNGILFVNIDKTQKDNHRFYFEELFTKGTVNFDNQNYFDVVLNYDVYKDLVIIKPNGNSDRRGIYLANEKTSCFEMNTTKFVNLSFIKPLPENFDTGFYEEIFKGKDFICYSKLKKSKSDLIVDLTVYDYFISSLNFILIKNNQFYKINSEKSISKLFPDQKKVITAFYIDNYRLESSNKKAFFKILFQTLNDNLK